MDGGNWNAIDVTEAKGDYTFEVRLGRTGASQNVGHPGVPPAAPPKVDGGSGRHGRG